MNRPPPLSPHLSCLGAIAVRDTRLGSGPPESIRRYGLDPHICRLYRPDCQPFRSRRLDGYARGSLACALPRSPATVRVYPERCRARLSNFQQSGRSRYPSRTCKQESSESRMRATVADPSRSTSAGHLAGSHCVLASFYETVPEVISTPGPFQRTTSQVAAVTFCVTAAPLGTYGMAQGIQESGKGDDLA